MTRRPIFVRFRGSKIYILATVCVSLFTDMITYSIIVPIIPFTIDAIERGRSPNNPGYDPYHSELHDPGDVSKQSGALLALFSVGLIAGSLGFGYLGDRLKHRQGLMLIGILGLIGSTLLFMFSEYYWELLVARFLQGIADACVWTLGMCLISDTFPIEELGTQMGRVMMFHSVGMVAGAPIGALYQTRGYKAPFIFCVALAGVDLVLRLFLVERKNNPPEWFMKQNEQQIEESRTATIDSSTPEEKKDAVTYWMLLKQHRLLAGMLMAFSNGTLMGVIESTLNVRLASEWGLNSGQIGVVFIAAVAPTFVASPLAGYLADKLGAKVVVIPTWIIGSVVTILMGIPNKSTAGGIAPLIILTVIQGFCVSAFLTPVLSEMGHVVQSLNPDGSDDGQGRSYALFNVAFALGGIVGPFLGGYLYKAIGFFWVNVVMGCFLLACAPYVFVFVGERGKFIVRQKRNEDEPIRSEDTEVYAAKTEMKPMGA